MPIDWDNLNASVKESLNSAAKKTDDKLASKISSITRLTDEEIIDLFPAPADAEKLVKLMQVVKSAQERNEKINAIVKNAEEFGGIILTLLNKFA